MIGMILVTHGRLAEELRRAMERHDTGKARVIPIFLRFCDWKGESFGKLAGLPTDARPVTDWRHNDKAFTDIAMGIRKAAEEIRSWS